MLKALYFANQTVSKVVQMPIYVNQEVAFNKEKAQVGALSGYCVCRCQSWRTLCMETVPWIFTTRVTTDPKPLSLG